MIGYTKGKRIVTSHTVNECKEGRRKGKIVNCHSRTVSSLNTVRGKENTFLIFT